MFSVQFNVMSLFTVLRDYQHYPFPEIFHLPELKLQTHATLPARPLSLRSLATTLYFLSL